MLCGLLKTIPKEIFMANARDMMKNVKHTALLVLMTLMFVVGFTVATPQKAEAGWDFELALGWDDLILDGNGYDKTNNSGFVGTLSFGYRLFDLVGIYYEQDLGYIQPEWKGEGKNPYDKYFKGASLVDARLFLKFLILETSLKLGVGAMYMKLPDIVKDDWQKWFAFRAGIGLAVALGSLRVGAEFDYTLGSADKNEFDRKDNTHFISVKGFVGYQF